MYKAEKQSPSNKLQFTFSKEGKIIHRSTVITSLYSGSCANGHLIWLYMPASRISRPPLLTATQHGPKGDHYRQVPCTACITEKCEFSQEDFHVTQDLTQVHFS